MTTAKFALAVALLLPIFSSGSVLAHGRVQVGIGIGIGAPIYGGAYYGGAYYGGPFYGPRYYGAPYYYPNYYPAPYYPAVPVIASPPVIVTPPPVYVSQPTAPTAAPPAPTGIQPRDNSPYWYYCPASRTYYPYVKGCSSDWQQITPPPQPGD